MALLLPAGMLLVLSVQLIFRKLGPLTRKKKKLLMTMMDIIVLHHPIFYLGLTYRGRPQILLFVALDHLL
jgi:hypothetical protein